MNDMNEKMKKVAIGMSIRMAFTMSFCMSLVGTLTSGHVTLVSFFVSFLLSTMISLAIGFVVPVGRISENLTRKRGMTPGKLSTRCVEALIFDLIYTPVITLAMVGFFYFTAMQQSGGRAQIPFIPMFLHAFVFIFVCCFFLVFLLQPLFFKSLLKKYDVHLESPQ